MGLLDRLKGLSVLEAPALAVAEKGFSVSDCSYECDTCTTKFPKMAVEESATLWNSTKPYGLHIVVTTGKSDWPHDATGVEGTLANAVASWGSSSSEKFNGLGDSSVIKTTVGSLSNPGLESKKAYIDEKTGDILLLPFFVWVRHLSIADVDRFLDQLVPDLIKFRDEGLKELPNTVYEGFPETSVETDPHQAYIFLCSHRTRDKRCGVTAPLMKKEFDVHLRDLDLYRDVGDSRPGGVNVSFINHIGGHKYAANVIIYLRSLGKNVWFARCTPKNAVPIVDECIVKDGRIWPDEVRIVQKYSPVEW